ncbi:hypothetical protein [Leyella stercorea]|uniref:hypothetical protein n=1 Tax=Leyella stercorea TaxID=363265 RepID=UPI001F15A4D0|nr:hypothetical protein [Leyella stercorea]MCF2614745.1 hypothetical protein [Leyella stercorea]
MKKGKKTNKSKEIENGSPTKYDRRRERWSVAVWCSLFVLAASLVCGMFVEMSLGYAAIVAISLISFLVSLCNAGSVYPEEPGSNDFPWYGGL